MTATTDTIAVDRVTSHAALTMLEIAVVNLRLSMGLPGDKTILNATALAALLADDEDDETD